MKPVRPVTIPTSIHAAHPVPPPSVRPSIVSLGDQVPRAKNLPSRIHTGKGYAHDQFAHSTGVPQRTQANDKLAHSKEVPQRIHTMGIHDNLKNSVSITTEV